MLSFLEDVRAVVLHWLNMLWQVAKGFIIVAVILTIIAQFFEWIL